MVLANFLLWHFQCAIRVDAALVYCSLPPPALGGDRPVPVIALSRKRKRLLEFTSGSAGIPKGGILEHRAVSRSCLGHGRINHRSTFATLIFTVVISECEADAAKFDHA